MYRNIISFLLVVGYGLYAHSQQLPLVYDQEHTGSHFAPPEMPGYDQLSECKDLPNPLAWSNGEGKVTHFNEWALSPFIDKFLLGKKTDTNNIQINVFDQ